MTTFLQKGLTAAVDRVKIIFASERCGSSSVVECHLAKVDVASPNLVYRSTVAPWPSGKAKLCKSFILQFDSGWRLQMKTQTKRLGLFLWRMAQSINRKRKRGFDRPSLFCYALEFVQNFGCALLRFYIHLRMAHRSIIRRMANCSKVEK